VNARGTKIKASVEGLKVLIRAKLDLETAEYEKDQAEYEKKIIAWAENVKTKIAAMTVDEIIGDKDRYGRLAYQAFEGRPEPPHPVDANHQRLLNMLELTSDDVIVLSLDSEFYRYLS